MRRKTNNSSDTLQHANYRLKYCLDYHGVGRVGEPKFLKYKNMAWIGSLSIIRWYWPEVKTLQNYLQSFCRDYDTFLTCVFHSFGCVWILDGLCRDDEGSAPLKDFVFYKDVKRTLRSFTEESSRVLKKHVPEQIKENVTGKSIRQAGITVLDAHPQMTPGLSNNRTGHCSGDNRKHYNFGTIAGSMPGMKVLAGVDSIHAPVGACRLRVLVESGCVSQEDIDVFIDNLVTNDLFIFTKRGRNRVILEVAIATVIQSYRSLVKDYEFRVSKCLCVGGVVVQRLRAAVYQSKLAPKGGPAADSLLFNWADEITRDLEEAQLHHRLEEIQGTANSQSISLLIQLIEKMRKEHNVRERTLLQRLEELKTKVDESALTAPQPLPISQSEETDTGNLQSEDGNDGKPPPSAQSRTTQTTSKPRRKPVPLSPQQFQTFLRSQLPQPQIAPSALKKLCKQELVVNWKWGCNNVQRPTQKRT